ncbi:glycoside hydrolase family 3 C-terminal domain-containing protein [Bifidobacterium sp. ESL0764]|uniref:glycoside hydrolase family 3 C-terminal domain-containing protein n=1 Tax=Bifidobacterium sp. ESL0764 TaxID=2983228 RepID=UPI0023F884F4|nr:glycoside hydrolase family 3 C-terminal domain-containing protein [Bifidobacterium sp. ESL0764]WEV65208.1 glycoside hydrolase family 3 C-terminal domain-containing protein [Bifidobacterium sp. ESL0764]
MKAAKNDLSERLTLEQKASLTSGATTWTSVGIEGCVDSMHMSDGPYGLRYQGVEGDSLGIASSVPATCFPPAAGLASTWDRDMVGRVGAALGQEARSLGVSMLLGPGLNIKRSPLGGRNFEYPSEDPYLAGQFGVAFVKGVQSQGVSAVPKHFAANNQETDRFRVDARIDERTFREIYLPAFEQTVKQARPWALMCSYNKVNGEYASQNRRLLTDILRKQWGFDGVVVSDWGAVNDRAAALAAGLDMEMPPSGTDERIVEAVRQGGCPQEALNATVDRISLLADRTQAVRAEARPDMDVDAHDELARQAAREALVLLKNDGVLPLNREASCHVAVIGELAHTPRYQGGGSSHVTATHVSNLLDGLRQDMPLADVSFAPGYVVDGTVSDASMLSTAVDTAKQADVAIVCVGYLEGDESEGMDKKSIDLAEDQRAVLEAVLKTGVPVIVVVSGGGVMRIGDWGERCNALLEGWLLGQNGGLATADVISGLCSPSGRLSETIPNSLDDTPSRLHFPGSNGVVDYGEGLYVGYRYYDTLRWEVAYPFGFGLSYTTFEYSDFKVSTTGDTQARVTFTVTNTGSCHGADVPQIYVSNGLPDRPVHELKGFERVELDPGQSAEVSIDLRFRAFAVWDVLQNRWRVYPGDYRIELAHSSRDVVQSLPVTLHGDGYAAILEPMSTIGEWMDSPYGMQVIKPLVDGVAKVLGGSNPSPELHEMFRQMPLIKLVSWGVGLSEQDVDHMVDQAERLRQSGEKKKTEA